METRIERGDLKHSLVKQIIFRSDYEGVIDKDIEDVIAQIRKFIYDNGFTEFEESNEIETNIQFNPDMVNGEQQSIPVNRIIYRFTKNQFEEIVLSKNYLVLTINIVDSYESFDNYMELMVFIINALTKTTDYFKILRIGLRKVNICLINDLDNINKVFSTKAYSLTDWLGSDNFEYIGNNNVTNLINDIYNINYVRNILRGAMVENDVEMVAFQLIVDIDIFIENIVTLKQICQNKNNIHKSLTEMNDIIFELFTDSLQNNFLKQLTQDELSDEYSFVMGVN
ncbi:TIGR04255 family protein [uncultured Dubosiella sp.]|uniref:TIGR04255 family protein n=2 Tax=uncultured Dubosiella sp. TaxID=1937011 RepID=UPI00272D5E50|nr:TIGR04255 family protein [uncultured Dubosiella sp.]